MNKVIKQNLIRFIKKTFYRVMGKIIEIGILFAIGYSLGLKLVRY